MSCDTWVVIPTYWGEPGAGIYDHPTPLDGESTLAALLDSLVTQDFERDFKVLLLVSTTRDDLNDLAISRIRRIVHKYISSLDIEIADQQTASKLEEFLNDHDLDMGIGRLRGYAAVRNLQLLIPAAMGAEIIIALDDDEIVAVDYLQKAIKYVGKSVSGEKVLAIAGPYLDETGSPYLEEPIKETNLLLDKSILMNQAVRQLCEDRSGISISSIAFGGNMVLSRDLFSQVGFDPGITRGEDIDYLINARISGFNFYFDPELTIIHHPPRHYEAPQYAKIRQDVVRFEYERVKIEKFGIDPESLVPYPGGLMVKDFMTIALNALKLESSPEMESAYGSPAEIIDFSRRNSKAKIEEYKIFRDNWVKAMEILVGQGTSSFTPILSSKSF